MPLTNYCKDQMGGCGGRGLTLKFCLALELCKTGRGTLIPNLNLNFKTLNSKVENIPIISPSDRIRHCDHILYDYQTCHLSIVIYLGYIFMEHLLYARHRTTHSMKDGGSTSRNLYSMSNRFLLSAILVVSPYVILRLLFSCMHLCFCLLTF